MNRMPLICFACLLSHAAFSQTEPIIPQTPDVRVPQRIAIPNMAELGERPLSVEEAVAIAKTKSPQVGKAHGTVVSSHGKTLQARSALGPQFGANAGFTQSSARSSNQGNQNRFDAAATVDQLLFDFGRTRDDVQQQTLLERAQQGLFSRTMQTVELDARVAYYDYSQAENNVSIAKANVDNRQRQLALADAKLKSGLGAPADLIRAKTDLADAVVSLTDSENQATNARVSLARTLGVDPRTPIVLSVSHETAPAAQDSLEDLVKSALDQRPDVRAAQLSVTAARYSISFASKINLPRLAANAGVNGRGFNDPFETQNAQFGITISWTFGDSGFAAGRVQEAKGSEEIARSDLIDLTQGVISEVSQAFVDLHSAQQKLETAQVQVANANELLRISEGRYSGGIGQFLEVTDASSSVVSAQRNLSQAQYDLERARARMKAAIGG